MARSGLWEPWAGNRPRPPGPLFPGSVLARTALRLKVALFACLFHASSRFGCRFSAVAVDWLNEAISNYLCDDALDNLRLRFASSSSSRLISRASEFLFSSSQYQTFIMAIAITPTTKPVAHAIISRVDST